MEGLLQAPAAPPRKLLSRSELVARLHFVFGGGVQIAAAYAKAADISALESLCGDLARSLGLGFTAASLTDWVSQPAVRATLPSKPRGAAAGDGATWRQATFLVVTQADERRFAAAAAKLRAETAVRRRQCVVLAFSDAGALSPELHDLAGMAFSARGRL